MTGAGDTDGGGRRDGGRSGARQRRRVGTGGAMAVKRFAAFAAGESVDDVDMIGGVHVLAGAKRAPGELAERLMQQRSERGERVERRERQRGMAGTGSAGGAARSKRAAEGRAHGRPGDDDDDDGDGDEFGGAGGWGAGGLGDRTGVG